VLINKTDKVIAPFLQAPPLLCTLHIRIPYTPCFDTQPGSQHHFSTVHSHTSSRLV
jgi:hypothetical protein